MDGIKALRPVIETMWPKIGQETLDIYISKSNDLSRRYGPRTAIKILKDINSKTRLTVLGRTDKSSNLFGGIWFKINSKGLPRFYSKLWTHLELNPRLVLFITNTVYTLQCEPDFDIKTVESPAKSVAWMRWANDFQSFVQNTLPTRSPDVETCGFHFSLKSGPLGPGSIIKSALEIALYHKTDKVNWFIELCSKVGYTNLSGRFAGLYQRVLRNDMLDQLLKHKDVLNARGIAKLAFLSAAAGKTRIVYILSWWAQQLLYPLHVNMMDWLKLQPNDATFNQSGAMKDLLKWTLENNQDIYSFDLSAATDRWPRHHQYIVLQHMYGDAWADVWLNVMEVEPYVPKLGRFVKYAVGQPMGAYASWSTLALSHHALIRYASYLINEKNPKYWVLGDDVLIKGHALANKYKDLINELGVDISISKSLVPNGISPSAGEFAKHIVRDGVDYTPASPNLMLEICKSHQWWKMSELLMDLKRHYGLDLIVFNDDQVAVSEILEKFMSKLSNKQRQNVLVTLTNPESNLPHLVSLEPRSIKDPLNLGLPDNNGLFERSLVAWNEAAANPWKGVTNLELLTYKLDLVETAMQNAIQSQYKLREGLHAASNPGFSQKSEDFLLKLPHHPIWDTVMFLEEIIYAGEYQLAHGDLPPIREGTDRALIDAQQLFNWLVLNKTKEYTTHSRESYNRSRNFRVLELYQLISGTKQSALQPYGDDDWA